jgi:hypothetical protein
MAKAFAPDSYRATRGSRFGIGNLIGAALGFINPMLGLAYRGIKSIPGVFQNLKQFNSLTDFYNTMKNKDEDEDDMSQYNQLGLYTDRTTPEYYNDLDNELALGTTSNPYGTSVGTTTPINTVDGIVNTNAFANNRKDFNINNADLYQTTDDGQMYVDEEIASRRFP